MRTYSQGRSRSAVPFVLTAAAMTLALASGRPAAAQTATTSPSESTFAIRAGGYIPANSRIETNVGKLFTGAGVDYVMQRNGPLNTTIVSVDYINRESGGRHLRIIPLTFGQVTYSQSSGTSHTYMMYGAGIYFINQTLPDANTGFNITQNQNAYGGYVGAGVTLSQNLFVEGRYHVLTSVGGVNAGGLQVTAGIRF